MSTYEWHTMTIRVISKRLEKAKKQKTDIMLKNDRMWAYGSKTEPILYYKDMLHDSFYEEESLHEEYESYYHFLKDIFIFVSSYDKFRHSV